MNELLRQHKGIAAPFLRDNINTDVIIPSREMKRVSKLGLADGLFANLRYSDGKRQPDSDFMLNNSPYDRASILLVGENFGCGSSREHAVWALKEFGFRVLIGESFGSIFQDNCHANGVLTVELDADTVETIARWAGQDPQAHQCEIDLETCAVQAAGQRWFFEMAEEVRHRLLGGLSPIDLTLKRHDEIVAFFTADRAARPWLHEANMADTNPGSGHEKS